MSSLASSHHASSADPAPRIAVILLAILQILTPTLPVLGIGEPIGSQSDEVHTLITPAGWAFSIWGPLYTGSLLFAIYQALPRQRNKALVAQLRWPAAGAFLGNALWAAYTQMAGLTVISAAIIVFTLVCLLAAYRRISDWGPLFSTGERWFAVLPLSALAAWLTAATIVNVTAALRFHGLVLETGAPLVTALVVLVGGVIPAAALLRGRGNPPYGLVFLWALAAIYASGGQQAGEIAAATLVAAVFVIAGMLLGLRRGGTARWFG